MTADEYKKQYEQQQQENQNRYYIAQKQNEIESLKRTIEINNTWYDKLEQVKNKLSEYITEIDLNRSQPARDILDGDSYAEWEGNEKTVFGNKLMEISDAEIVSYLNSLIAMETDINSKMTELENKNIDMWNQIETLNKQINSLKYFF